MAFDEAIASELLKAVKTLVVGDWLVRDDGSQELLCDFDGKHPQLGRLELKIRVAAGSPGKYSFVLLLRRQGYSQRDRIYALDVNAPPHSNPIKQGDPDSGRIFGAGQTHEHNFEDRTSDGNVDGFARLVDPPPRNFLEAVEIVCAKLHVTTPPTIPLPPQQGTLV